MKYPLKGRLSSVPPTASASLSGARARINTLKPPRMCL